MEQKRAAVAEIADFGDVPRSVGVEIDSGERRLAAVVLGAERQGQRTAAACLVFEGDRERPTNAAKTAVQPDDQRVQLPDTPVGRPPIQPSGRSSFSAATAKPWARTRSSSVVAASGLSHP